MADHTDYLKFRKPSALDEMKTELLELDQRIDNLKDYRCEATATLSGRQIANVQAQMLAMYNYYSLLQGRITEYHDD